MTRQLRTVTAFLAVLALAATLPATCTCAPQRPARTAEHDCCAPPPGVRAADHGCCEAPGQDAAPAASAQLAAAPAFVAFLPAASLALAVTVPVRALAAAASSPPLVLRI